MKLLIRLHKTPDIYFFKYFVTLILFIYHMFISNMFISNKELLNKLARVESKIDSSKKQDVSSLNYANYIIEQVKNIFSTNYNDIYTKLDIMNEKINNMDSNINQIYFDNEVIKHQLLLEGILRDSIDEIDNLSITIKQTILKIDKLIEMGTSNSKN